MNKMLAVVLALSSGCIPPQAARVVQLERYEQRLTFDRCPAPGEDFVDVSAACADQISCVLGRGGFLGDKTFRTILATHGGNSLVRALVGGEIRFVGDITFVLAIRDFDAYRMLFCPFGSMPLLGAATNMFPRGEHVSVGGNGQFRVLDASDTQLLTFNFTLPATEFPLEDIVASKKPVMEVPVVILPDNLPSGPVDLTLQQPVTYRIALDTDSSWYAPGRRLRISYEPEAHAALRSRKDANAACEDEIGRLTIKRKHEQREAMWIDLRLLDCIAPW